MIYSPASQITHISTEEIQDAVPVNKDGKYIIRLLMKDNSIKDWSFLTMSERDTELDVVYDMISLFGK